MHYLVHTVLPFGLICAKGRLDFPIVRQGPDEYTALLSHLRRITTAQVLVQWTGWDERGESVVRRHKLAFRDNVIAEIDGHRGAR